MALSFTTSRTQVAFGGPVGKSLLIVEGDLVIDAVNGAVAGDIPASLFGLNRILGALSIVLSDDSKVYFGAAAIADGSLLIGGGASAATQDLPVGTYAVKLIGTY